MCPININNSAQCLSDMRADHLNEARSLTGRKAVIDMANNVAHDPVAFFKQEPHRTAVAAEALKYELQKDLPKSLFESKLSTDGERIKNLIGIIYSDVKQNGNKDDIKLLDKLCHGLEREKNDNYLKPLSELVGKYGLQAFKQTTNSFIDHCEVAWRNDHDKRGINVQDKATFKACLDVCKSVLEGLGETLCTPNQAKEEVGQKMNQFFDTCVAISKTPIYYDESADGPADVPEINRPPKNIPEPFGPRISDGPNGHHMHIPPEIAGKGVVINFSPQNINNNTVGGDTKNVGESKNTELMTILRDQNVSPADKLKMVYALYNYTPSESQFLGNLQRATLAELPGEQISTPHAQNKPEEGKGAPIPSSVGILDDVTEVDSKRDTNPAAPVSAHKPAEPTQVMEARDATRLNTSTAYSEPVILQAQSHAQVLASSGNNRPPELNYGQLKTLSSADIPGNDMAVNLPLDTPPANPVSVHKLAEPDLQAVREVRVNSRLNTSITHSEPLTLQAQYARAVAPSGNNGPAEGMQKPQPGVPNSDIYATVMKRQNRSAEDTVAQITPHDTDENMPMPPVPPAPPLPRGPEPVPPRAEPHRQNSAADGARSSRIDVPPKQTLERKAFTPANLESVRNQRTTGTHINLTTRQLKHYDVKDLAVAQNIVPLHSAQGDGAENEQKELNEKLKLYERSKSDSSYFGKLDSLGSQAEKPAVSDGYLEFQQKVAQFRANKDKVDIHHE